MAGDEEVEAVARAMVERDLRFATPVGLRAGVALDLAEAAVAALDRVRSRPVSGTEGEGHHGSFRQMAVPYLRAEGHVWVRSDAFNAALDEIERVSGTEPDTLRAEIERLKEINAELVETHNTMLVGGTEPDTAKLVAERIVRRLNQEAEAFGLMSDSLSYANVGRDAIRDAARTIRREFLAGFSVDAGKAEE
jgi:hypothetical protein